MKVRLYWHDGTVEEVQEVQDGTIAVVRQTTAGQ